MKESVRASTHPTFDAENGHKKRKKARKALCAFCVIVGSSQSSNAEGERSAVIARFNFVLCPQITGNKKGGEHSSPLIVTNQGRVHMPTLLQQNVVSKSSLVQLGDLRSLSHTKYRRPIINSLMSDD